MPSLEVRAEERADHGRVVVDGELDLATEPVLGACVDQVLTGGGGRPLVVDVRRVSFIDSSGLRALLAARDAARRAGTTMALAVSDGAVTRLLDVAGIRAWFDYE